MARLTRDDILAGWSRLGELAAQEGRTIDLLVIGGAVMAVHFRAREATADVDAGPLLHESAGIRVTSAALPHLLALKLMAWRDDVDFNDAKRLLEVLRRPPEPAPSSPEELWALVEPYVVAAGAQ